MGKQPWVACHWANVARDNLPLPPNLKLPGFQVYVVAVEHNI